MGYAHLHYNLNNTIPLGHIVHDIVGVITGTYTSTSSLSPSANIDLCTIVNSAGRGNWEFLFPATHGTRSSSTNNYVLRAPCIESGSKYKFVRIRGAASADMSTNTGNLRNDNTNANNGIVMTAATAATSATALSNESHYNTYANTGNNYWFQLKQLFYGNFFYISWSSRHLLILSNGFLGAVSNTNDLTYTGCFEMTETSMTRFRNVAPFCLVNMTGTSLGNYNTTVTGPSSVDSNTRYNVFQIFNHFNPATNIASGIVNFYNNANSQGDDMTIAASSTNTYPTVYTKTSTGAVAMFMQPLFFHQAWNGIPHHFISNLCDVYRVPPNFGNNGDRITVGADTYVYFNVPSGHGIAVKRA